MTAHIEHAHLHARGSLSHVGRPLKKGNVADHVDTVEVKGSLSHIKTPAGQKKGPSLSHIKVPAAKKDSLSHIKLHLPEANMPDNRMEFIHKSPKDRVAQANARIATTEVATVVTVDSVVIVTASPTPTEVLNTPVASSRKSSSTEDPRASYAHAKSIANRPHTWTGHHSNSASQTTTQKAHSIVHTPLHTSLAVSSPAIVATTSAATALVGPGVATSRTIAVGNTQVSATPAGISPMSNDKFSSSQGLSSGGKAGVAFAVLIAVAIAAGLVLFCLRRRRNQNAANSSEVLTEKHGSFFGSNQPAPMEFRGSVTSTRTASTAPRLSLRPVTQFLPNIMDNKSSATLSEKPKSSWERQQTNPFDDAAVLNEKQARPESPPANPFDEGDGRKSPAENAETLATTVAAPVAVAAQNAPAGSAPASATGARGPNNVHRVQLDFKPSMDDELELKSGQLVRMLHEYDDGWALCIRMDRSQQGVCPRTCLSKLPVKPRPQGPPPNGPNGRPRQSPNHSPSASASPNMVPRPLTPNMQQRERSQTLVNAPAPQTSPTQRNRSQSVADSGAVPSRKPVPGQAL